MPLRDHFHPPLSDVTSWESLHAQWPAMIVMELNGKLPARYIASPRIHLGPLFEIDVAALTQPEDQSLEADQYGTGNGGVAVWAPPQPTLTLTTELPEQDEYEVWIIDNDLQRLVAAIEIVSPSNKDRPDSRRAFVAKCATLLQHGTSVSIVDLVTSRRTNLYGELMDLLGHSDPTLSNTVPSLYAVTCRWRAQAGVGRLETWTHALTVGRPLPTLPLWLEVDLSMPLDLESSYEETCRTLRIR
jgi:hypothetical protein